METAAQIKDDLISKIRDSQNVNFLKAVRALFDSAEHSIFYLTEEQKHSIEIGRKEIKDGQFVENSQVISEMKKWLEKE